MKTSLYVEYKGSRIEDKDIVNQVKELWVNEGNKIKDIDTLNLYIKPEEHAAYYVINETITGKLALN
ncbi:hypothetical protein lbkm_0716 [Lachnospiraceae bacterium KM106-2]|nr:hypothetical protein lbkm_0716 [Lachnospiraceae bacterium KM106-2]